MKPRRHGLRQGHYCAHEDQDQRKKCSHPPHEASVNNDIRDQSLRPFDECISPSPLAVRAWVVTFGSILLLALGLAMDAAAVSAVRGLATPRILPRHAALVAIFF